MPVKQVCMCRQLNRFIPTFSGSNTNAIIHGQDKDLTIPNFTFFTASTSRNDRIDSRLDEFLVDCDLQLHLSQQVDAEPMPSIQPCLAPLAAKPLAVHDGQTKHFNLGQSLFDGFQLTWLDDGDDQFHGYGSPT